ncbi:MAG: hydratase [Crocosphaera sp.]|nr:hydratase [Crocosphaera sp.]
MKKIQLLFLLAIIFFPFVEVTAQPKNIDNKSNINLSILLTNLPSITLENIAKKITNSYINKRLIKELNYNFTSEEAQIIQEKFISNLSSYQGELIGYKAGLTNKKTQDIFKTNQPVLGTLLENMLLPSGIKVPANFGCIPRIEGDLMVRVSSEKINEAKTPEETLKYLDAIIPFLELPDLVYDKNIQLNGKMLIAINVGARLGVVGDVIPLNKKTIQNNSLKNIVVTLKDESGKIIAQGNSNSLLGDPLNVVFWIKEKLESQGKMLKKGDLLSLGSITPLLPVETGKTILAEYEGLPKTEKETVIVTFE